jgi:acid phosphatase (class A)
LIDRFHLFLTACECSHSRHETATAGSHFPVIVQLIMRHVKWVAAYIAIVVSAGMWAQTKAAKKTDEGTPASARTPYFIDLGVLDVRLLVPPPPAQESATTKEELVIVHRLEKTRTAEQVAAARADDKEEDIFSYRDVMGEGFTAEALPVTAALSAHVHNEESVVGGPLKKSFQRPRPYQYDGTLHPVCALNKEPTSYPSGHTLSGYLLAFTLAQIAPEKSQQILKRADEYAHNRLVCGVHYPSDLEASHRIAYVVFGYMMASPRFQRELAAARIETREHLGLPPAEP